MEYQEFSAKKVDDAITEACETLGVPSDRLDYEIVSNGSSGFLGIAAKPAVIKARITLLMEYFNIFLRFYNLI